MWNDLPEENNELLNEKLNKIGTKFENKDGINIELSEEIASGIYSNLAVINHSNSEFVVDFIQIMPGIPKAKVRSRILLTPQHAKRLNSALKENIKNLKISLEPFKNLTKISICH